VVFAVSGLLKAGDPGRFLLDLQAFGFVPYAAAYPLALLLPWLEILTGVALLSGRLLAGARLLGFAMCGGFALFTLLAWRLGISADCGCFGDWLVFPNHTTHLLFVAALAAALALAGTKVRPV
jgi:hypothetical protein